MYVLDEDVRIEAITADVHFFCAGAVVLTFIPAAQPHPRHGWTVHILVLKVERHFWVSGKGSVVGCRLSVGLIDSYSKKGIMVNGPDHSIGCTRCRYSGEPCRKYESLNVLFYTGIGVGFGCRVRLLERCAIFMLGLGRHGTSLVLE